MKDARSTVGVFSDGFTAIFVEAGEYWPPPAHIDN